MSTTTRLSIEQYDQMIADGFFENEQNRERIELIDGELREMSPIGPRHERIVDLLTRWSFKVLPDDQVWVRIQGSFAISELMSVPEPDVAWLRDKDYSLKRPEPDDVLLIIEVADSSLSYDRGKKAALYAAAGIADYWVVDILHRSIHVYRDPQPESFGSCETLSGSDRISPLTAPTAVLVVESLFPSVDPDAAVEAES